MSAALTDRQQQVLDFIRSSIAERGFPPTLREIGSKLRILSTNGVNDHLRALERKGYLARDEPGKTRAIRLLTQREQSERVAYYRRIVEQAANALEQGEISAADLSDSVVEKLRRVLG